MKEYNEVLKNVKKQSGITGLLWSFIMFISCFLFIFSLFFSIWLICSLNIGVKTIYNIVSYFFVLFAQKCQHLSIKYLFHYPEIYLVCTSKVLYVSSSFYFSIFHGPKVTVEYRFGWCWKNIRICNEENKNEKINLLQKPLKFVSIFIWKHFMVALISFLTTVASLYDQVNLCSFYFIFSHPRARTFACVWIRPIFILVLLEYWIVFPFWLVLQSFNLVHTTIKYYFYTPHVKIAN